MIKSIRETLIIPEDSRETFLPLNHFLKQNGVLLAGISYLTKGYQVIRLRPDHHFVGFTFGKCGFFINHSNGKTYKLKKNSMLYLPKKILHHYESTSKWNLVWFHLETVSRWQNLPNEGPIIREDCNPSALLYAENELIDESESQKNASTVLVKLYSEIIYHLLSRELDFSVSPSERYVINKMHLLWQKISQSLEKKWSCKEMASEVNMSIQHFARMNRKIYGSSPGRRFTEIKINRAVELLQHYNLAIYEVAELLGYSSQFAFSSAFKRITGKTPSDFKVIKQ